VLERVYRHAGDLTEEHGLRGFDAIPLASFLEVAAQADDELRGFSAFDTRLSAPRRNYGHVSAPIHHRWLRCASSTMARHRLRRRALPAARLGTEYVAVLSAGST
jgi:hypothetical protein